MNKYETILKQCFGHIQYIIKRQQFTALTNKQKQSQNPQIHISDLTQPMPQASTPFFSSILPPILLLLILCMTPLCRPLSTSLSKPLTDPRQYTLFTLSNRLRILHIYDEQSIRSVCSIHVGVGSRVNPGIQLAHLLEHTLLAGSQEYQDGYYANWVRENSGVRKSYTSDTQTNYYLQIKSGIFEQSLQILSSHFKSPTLSQSSVQSAIQTIQNEFISRQNDPSRKKFQVLRYISSQNQTSFSQFPSGNAQTLTLQEESGTDLQTELVKFYGKYYSANLMYIVLYTNLTKEWVEETVMPMWEGVEDRDVEIQGEKEFQDTSLGKWVAIEIQNYKNVLQFYWILQIQDRKIGQYLSHILQKTCNNSLHSILFSHPQPPQSLSTTLTPLSTQNLLTLSLTLPNPEQPLSSDYLQQLYQIVMNYVKELEPDSNSYLEIWEKKRIEYQVENVEKFMVDKFGNVGQFVREIGAKMADFGFMGKEIDEGLLQQDSIFTEYDEIQQDIKQAIMLLNQDNLIILQIQTNQLPQQPQPQLEPIYSTKFSSSPLPPVQSVQSLSLPMSLPSQPMPPNPYIPLDYTLYQFQDNSTIPVKISQNFYLLQDSTYNSIKSGIQVRIYTKNVFEFNVFYALFLKEMLENIGIVESGRELGTEIVVTGGDCVAILLYGIRSVVMGILRDIVGVVTELHRYEGAGEVYKRTVREIGRTYKEFAALDLDTLADNILSILLTENIKFPNELIGEMEQGNFGKFAQNVDAIWGDGSQDKGNVIKYVAVGNFQESSIIQLINQIDKILSNNENGIPQIPTYGTVILDRPITYTIVTKPPQLPSPDRSAPPIQMLVLYYQSGAYTEQLFYTLNLLRLYFLQPLTNNLTIQAQVASGVEIQVFNNRGVLGLAFKVQTTNGNLREIGDKVRIFLKQFGARIDQQFSSQGADWIKIVRENVYKRQIRPLLSLKSLFLSIVSQIRENTLFFTRRNTMQSANYIIPITVTQMNHIWQSMVNNITEIVTDAQGYQSIVVVDPSDADGDGDGNGDADGEQGAGINYVEIRIVHYEHYEEYQELGEQGKQGDGDDDIGVIKQDAKYYDDYFYCCN